MLDAPRSRQIWYRSCVLLTTLLLGLLSMSIDLLEDHTTLATSPASNHSETGSKLHLVRRQVDGETGSCNVCFLDNLLRHTLMPAISVIPADELFVPHTENCRVLPPGLEFSRQVNRGPPAA